MMEPETQKWLAARWADTAYFLGEYHRRRRTRPRAVKDEFYDAFAARLARIPGDRSQETGDSQERRDGGQDEALPPPIPRAASGRKVLPLELTGTPAPTVYELLARFWKHPLPNPGAEQPPLDGLPDAAERDRAERAGWIAREFTLSLDAAVELIGRGVPFLVTLVEAGFSQPRLVVGADAVRGTVLLADGVERRPVEAPVASLVERFAPFGPRCLALVPAATRGIARFTCTSRWPGSRRAPRRAEAAAHARPRGRGRGLDADARRVSRPSAHDVRRNSRLARYDAHPVRLLASYDALLAAHPHESTWVLAKAAVLRDLNRMPERLALLEAEGSALDAEPLVMQSLAQVLLPLPRRQEDAARLLRRSVRNRPPRRRGTTCSRRSGGKNGASWTRRRCTASPVRSTTARISSPRRTSAPPARPSRCRRRCASSSRRPGARAVPAPAATRALFHALMDRDEPEQAHAALDQAIKKLQEQGDRKPEVANSPRRRRSATCFCSARSATPAAGRHSARPTPTWSLPAPLVPPVVWHQAAGRGRADQARPRRRRLPTTWKW